MEPVSVTPSTMGFIRVVESTTTTTVAPLQPLVFDPIPPGRANLGGDHHDDVPIPAFGMIEIPKIGLVHPIFEGFEESQIHWGPGHWPGSAEPGAAGNAVFAGHRVTHTRPFLDIDLLAAGDQIIFRTNRGTATYEVTDHLIVPPDATWIAKPTPDATVTLFGCHPKHSARQRYVVRGKLVGWAPRT
jgi:sortase A